LLLNYNLLKALNTVKQNMKIILFTLLIAGALAKGCTKILSKNSDEILVSSANRLVSPSAKVLARQYIAADTTVNSEDLENWNDTTLTNYFLLDLSKLKEQISNTTEKDNKLKDRVIRNYTWLEKNNILYSTKIVTDTTNDTKNMELEKGAKYFVRLYMAENYVVYKDNFKRNHKELTEYIKQNEIKEDLIFTEDYYRRNYYPLNEELLSKILNETE